MTHDEFGGGKAVGSTVLPSAICNSGSHHGEIAGMPVALSLGSCPGDIHVLCGSSKWDRVCSSVYTSLIVSSTAPAGGSICGGEESIGIGRLILIIHDVYLLLIMLNR